MEIEHRYLYQAPLVSVVHPDSPEYFWLISMIWKEIRDKILAKIEKKTYANLERKSINMSN